MLNKLLKTFFQTMTSLLGTIPAFIYSYLFSQYFTKATYKMIAQRNEQLNEEIKNVLDIGTATGHPLYSIIENFKDAQVLGIDIDNHYIPACQKLFTDKKNVTIQHMNFFDLEQRYPKTSFDIIIFGSSFMLMPDQSKAIEIAKNKLNKNGKIYFLLTLYENKSSFNHIMQKIKPLLKYLTTIDFGKVTYKSEFESFLEKSNLYPSFKDRCSGNFFLKLFKFYIYEVKVQK